MQSCSILIILILIVIHILINIIFGNVMLASLHICLFCILPFLFYFDSNEISVLITWTLCYITKIFIYSPIFLDISIINGGSLYSWYFYIHMEIITEILITFLSYMINMLLIYYVFTTQSMDGSSHIVFLSLTFRMSIFLIYKFFLSHFAYDNKIMTEYLGLLWSTFILYIFNHQVKEQKRGGREFFLLFSLTSDLYWKNWINWLLIISDLLYLSMVLLLMYILSPLFNNNNNMQYVKPNTTNTILPYTISNDNNNNNFISFLIPKDKNN